jgi:hypothetical protein
MNTVNDNPEQQFRQQLELTQPETVYIPARPLKVFNNIRQDYYPVYKVYTFDGRDGKRAFRITTKDEGFERDLKTGFIEEYLANPSMVMITHDEPVGGGAKKAAAKSWKLTAKSHTCKDGVKRRVYSDGKGANAVKCKVGDRFVYKKI